MAAAYTMAKGTLRKQLTYSSVDKWVSKVWHTYAMEYYPVFKRKGI